MLSPVRCGREGASEPGGSMERLEVGAQAVVDVAPLGGRLVLFLAGAVEHAVLPCSAERLALTAWCQ
jgi:SM-20-related protein